ncbi:MAG: response regulator, partial [Deltaproteobacteria bacterium]|nr:response regulator [Deltaproteobacteria bacterium]
MCDSLNALLSNRDYQLQTCNSAREALECLAKNNFDLVLLDIVIPDMSGLQIMDYINSQDTETLVIVITGHASIESAIESLRRGAYDYLRKPFEPEELLTTVDNCLHFKKLKRENKFLRGKLMVSEERYRYLVQNSPDIIYILDEHGNFTFLNHAVELLLNLKIDQLVGKHYTIVIHDEDLDKAKYFFNERRTGDRAASGITLRLKVSSDRDELNNSEVNLLTIELKSKGLYDKEVTEKPKKFLGTYGVARDIGDRKRFEYQLYQAQKTEAIATLAGGIAHQFNNALVGISGNIELLQMDLPENESIKRYYQAMKDSTHRMTNLTNQLLAYAQGGKYQPTTISLNDFIKDTLPLIKHDIDPTIRVETNLPVDIFYLNADLTQMQMVLSALVNNAAESIEGEGRIMISISSQEIDEEFVKNNPELEPGSYVCLIVEDTGKGMDEKTKSRVFDPFFTTKLQGRGLGMAAVYGIIKSHDGWISIESELSEGTAVNIYLPSVKVEAEAEKKPGTQLPKREGTILVIEDEDVVVDIFRKMLERLGYRILLAQTGTEALNIAKTYDGDIDLAILDVVLPDMGGQAIYPLLMEARPNLKVLVCSGYSIDGHGQEIIDAGAQSFLQKPFSLETLYDKLNEVLNHTT